MTATSLTVTRGHPRPQDVALAAADALGDGEAARLTLDARTMSRGDALLLVEQLRQALVALPWPLR
ncbi:hypothetical protein [Sphingomonas sp. BK235]|uniref:hypothetical protein n=1 Tax=Sphingomonas sp. BK235 TaxID=2512131 RepID=UPI00104D285C|nr:hypothetical protein [Sphingomonas sp. BK235]TCP35912.1 hypothetical protein EV292_102502 [Sphingomonas sp. BK235]